MDIFDEILKQQHRVEARANHLSDEIIDALQAARADITGKLTALRVRFLTAASWQEEALGRKKAFLEAQRAEVERLISQIFVSSRPEAFSAALDTMSHVQAQTARFAPLNSIIFGAGSPRLDLSVVEAWAESSMVENRTMTEWLSRMAESSAARITQAGRQAMIEGFTVPQTARLLREGIEGCRPQIEAIARTYLLSASNFAREQAVERLAGNMDFQWMYIATLDGRTCAVCGADDKRKFQRNKPRPSLPRHINCRCVFVPVFNGEPLVRLPERAAVKESGRTVHHRDGSTSTAFTVESVEHTAENYAQWIERQVHDDPGFARQVLGRTRFELLRDGKITLPKMVVDGRIKKLSEL